MGCGVLFKQIWVNYTVIFHQPEIRWLGGYSPHKPPFGVRSGEVVVIHPEQITLCPSEVTPLLLAQHVTTKRELTPVDFESNS